MSVYHRSTAKSRILQEYRNREEEIAEAVSRQMNSSKLGLDSDKRIRREIANSNERRRMQSINAGFQLLRSMIPHNEGEKLSKAAILQQTTEYITHLQQEKVKINAQNAYYKRILNEVTRRCNIDLDIDIPLYNGSPPSKRKKRDTESSDEGITADLDDCKFEDVRREVIELRQQLDRERQLRGILENRARTVELSRFNEHTRYHAGRTDECQLASSYEKPCKEDSVARADMVPCTPLHIDLDTDRRLPASPPHKSDSSDSNCSSSYVSRRNLETIVEAIRHLEGDEISRIGRYHAEPLRAHSHHPINFSVPKVKEIEKDSINMSEVEDPRDSQLECMSRITGPSSPSSVHLVRLDSVPDLHIPAASAPHLTATKVVMSSSYCDKYPNVTNVLHGKSPQTVLVNRPGVIVQKS